MARFDFGGTLADFVVTSRRLGGLDVLGLSAATLTFWSAQSGGTRYTDLTLNGSAASSISVGTDGQVPKFQGPDGVTEMWADGGSARIRVVTLQGAPGPAGKDGANGLPGVNAVANDTATAGYLSTAGTATQNAADARYVSAVQGEQHGVYLAGRYGVQSGVVADQAPALNALIRAVPTGSVVRLPQLVYIASAIELLTESVTLEGTAGRAGTMVRAMSGFTDSQMVRNWSAADWQAGRTQASCGVTNGSTTVTTSSAASGDVGKLLRAAPGYVGGVQPGTTITAVNAGVSWTLSQSYVGPTGTISTLVGEPDHFYPPVSDPWNVHYPCVTGIDFDVNGNSNVTCLGRVHPQENSLIQNVTYRDIAGFNHFGAGNVGRADFGNATAVGIIAGPIKADREVQYGKSWKHMIYVDGTNDLKLVTSRWSMDGGQVQRPCTYFGAGNDAAYTHSPFFYRASGQVIIEQAHNQGQPSNDTVTLAFVGNVSAVAGSGPYTATLTATDGHLFQAHWIGCGLTDVTNLGNLAADTYISDVGSLGTANTCTITSASPITAATGDTFNIGSDSAFFRLQDSKGILLRDSDAVPFGGSSTTYTGGTAVLSSLSSLPIASSSGYSTTGSTIGYLVDTAGRGQTFSFTGVSGNTLTGFSCASSASVAAGAKVYAVAPTTRGLYKNTQSSWPAGIQGRYQSHIEHAEIGAGGAWTDGQPFIEDYAGNPVRKVRIPWGASGGTFKPTMVAEYNGANVTYNDPSGYAKKESTSFLAGGNGYSTLVTASTAPWQIPSGATQLRVTCVGGGGGSAGSAGSTPAQIGAASGGGGAGQITVTDVAVGAATTLNITVGNGGTAGAAGTANQAAAATSGGAGGTTTVTNPVTAQVVTAVGGGGSAAPANGSSNGGAGGGYGGPATVSSSSIPASGGLGGGSNSIGGRGGSAFSSGGSGGGGGGGANAGTANGSAGVSGTLGGTQAVGGAAGGGAPTPANAPANSGAGAGGAGGTATVATTGAAGANGAVGGSGYVLIEVLG